MNWLLFSQFLLVALFGGLAGWFVCCNYYKTKAWTYYEDAVKFEEELCLAEDLLEKFRIAATPIVHELEVWGDQTAWKDGPETDRVYPWYEIEPLAKCLKRLEGCDG